MTEINYDYKNTYTNEPTAPPSIIQEPTSNNNIQNIRIKRIKEVENDLKREIEYRSKLYKRYSKAMNIAMSFDGVIGLTSVGLGIALASTVVAAPIGAALAGVGIGLGVVAVTCVPAIASLRIKAKKHHTILTIAKSKLNTIHDHVTHAFEDGEISHEEFKLVIDEFEKYHHMKMESRKKFEAELSEFKKTEFIKQGRMEAIEKFKIIEEKRRLKELELDQLEA